MARPPVISRGEDAVFHIWLKDSWGKPYDLTGVVYLQLKMAMDPIGFVAVDSNIIPAVAATVIYDGITFTAVTGGTAGDAIALVFDGSTTVSTVVTAWNLANESNQVGYSGLGTVVPTAGTAQLDQGQNALQKVVANTPLQLGKLTITLRESDTAQLKLGKNLTTTLTFDKNDLAPAGNRKIILLSDSMTVETKFY